MRSEEMRSRLRDARVARLATVRPDGRPHIVPIVFAFVGERLVTAVDAKPKVTDRIQRLENIRANPDVEVIVDHYEEDWKRVWWVRLTGRARILEDGEPSRAAHAALRERYPQYERWGPLGSVIEVEVLRRRGWSAARL